jgi:hypothetical protein
LSNAANRFIIAIDESASMAASDVSPTRLEKAKAEAAKIIANMEAEDLTMIVAFSDKARVVSNYSSNKDLLRRRLASIKPTENTTSMREAIQVIAGLANPASDRFARGLEEGKVAVHATPPRLSVFTDGGFPDVEGLSVGNVQPEVVVIGPPDAVPPLPKPGEPRSKQSAPTDNVAILALSAARDEEKPDQFQVFGRVHNYRDESVKTEARLLRHDPKKLGEAGTLIDAISLTVGPQADQSFKFDLGENGLAELEVRIDVKDAMPLDNRAFTVFGTPRKAQVLLVTARNRYLADSLATLGDLSDVVQVTPEESKGADVQRDLNSGRYDLAIYDGYRPEKAPEANALYFGVMPPGKAFEKSKDVNAPVILDWDVSHPMMQYVRDLNSVIVQKAVVCEPPNGSTTLIDGDSGPLAFVSPRSGFSDAVIGFPLMDGDKFNTNWQLKGSFPLFLYNTIRALGNARESSGTEAHLPGVPAVLRADSTAATIDVYGPDGKKIDTVKRSPQGTFVFNGANETGIYQARWGKGESLSFAVNLFDPRESDLAPRGLVPEGLTEAQKESYMIKIGFNAVAGTRKTEPAVKDYWMPIAVGMLVIVLLEWYIYNRRVYV